jgi:hypothetical protein
LKQRWPEIREQLLSETYKPQPVKRVEIPKPEGGIRKLGISTALDRLIQQMALQVLQRSWEPTFSEHSYGFRPGRSAHQAVAQAQNYIAEGYSWTVDLRAELQAIADQAIDRAAFLRLAETLTAFLARLRSAAETLSVTERQRIVRLLVKDVLVGEDTITIRHSIPIPSGPPRNGGSQSPDGEDYLLCTGRDHAPYTKGNFQFERTVTGWRTRYSVLDFRLKG